MAGNWIFEWFDPSQDIRPTLLLRQLGLPVPTTGPPNYTPLPVVPLLLSNPDQGMHVRFRSLVGATGPDYVPVDQNVPFEPGSLLKFINVEEAEVDLRILFTADTQTLLWAQLQGMAYTFNPLRGPGVLRVTNPNGDQRYLNATCISGFKLDESTLQEKSVEASLLFYANDPYWYSAWSATTYRFNGGILIGTLPILPVVLGRGPTDSISRIPITNLGDVNSFPVITITGPYGDPILQNLSLTTNNVLSSNPGSISNTMANPIIYDFVNKAISVPQNTPPYEIVSGLFTITPTSTFWYVQNGTNWYTPTASNIIQISILGVSNNTTVNVFFRSAYSTMI